jgi:hypothetical protein
MDIPGLLVILLVAFLAMAYDLILPARRNKKP